VRVIEFARVWAECTDHKSRRAFEVPNFTPERVVQNFTMHLGNVRMGLVDRDGLWTEYGDLVANHYGVK
jgi:hypothetical protein